jgi:hypothetical protein
MSNIPPSRKGSNPPPPGHEGVGGNANPAPPTYSKPAPPPNPPKKG